jgi:hypothetical protein
VLERDAEGGHVVGQVRVVGDHQADVEVELAAAPAPHEVEQRVVVARDHHRHALRASRVVEAPRHVERAPDLIGELALELVQGGRQAAGVEHHSQEERAALGVGRVLVGLGDVGPALEEESRHRGDDAGAVLAPHQQAPGIHVLRGLRHLLPWTNLFTMAR